MRPLLLVLAGLALAGGVRAASFTEATRDLEPRAGLAATFIDHKTAHVLVALPKPDAQGVAGRYVYQVYLSASLGSTPVGLDRDQPGPTQILAFRRVGQKVYAEFENTAFRAANGSADEQRSVVQSFAHSTVWSGEIKAEGPDGALLVDITDFLTRDAFGVTEAMRRAKQGAFHIEPGLSHVDLAGVNVFPENLEFDADETFASDDPGSEVRGIAPDPHAITLTVHHSLVKLPEPGFTPRIADPRFDTLAMLVTDYSAPLGSPLVYRIAPRFRLEKIDPAAPRSRVKKPIVFYVDNAAPEPVRSALVEGARWWNDAFDAAGYIDAFQVKVLPQGVSPLDARYNVINWVHRQTRGWSYGEGIADPRTGEIIKGSVLLGSQRVRQDIIIYEGLVGAQSSGKGGPNDSTQVALARLRQLAVHETGHALGFAHNFAGSAFTDRGSVMDYPPPRVAIAGDRLDLSDAYGRGVGVWDLFTVDWLYGEPAPGVDETAWLDAKVRAGMARGLRYVTDNDARPIGSGHPLGALWDDGPDPVEGLRHAMEVRRIALAGFGLASLPAGAPTADLRRRIVPIYLYHRYETEAAAKLIGGVDFPYSKSGDGHERAVVVSADRQRAALNGLLETVRPSALDLPPGLVALLSSGVSDNTDPQFTTEVFGDGASPVFDLGLAAETAAEVTFSALLAPERLNRLADQGVLPLPDLLDATIGAVFADRPNEPAELRRRVRARLVADLRRAADDKAVASTVRADIESALHGLAERLAKSRSADPADRALARDIVEAIDPPPGRSAPAIPAAIKVPPGMPIGD